MFGTFIQNNSGGSYREPARFVIVEGESFYDIHERARDHQVYFDGCEDGRDCTCCGDRWYRLWEVDVSDEPRIFGTPVEAWVLDDARPLGRDVDEIHIYYLDGRVETLGYHAE